MNPNHHLNFAETKPLFKQLVHFYHLLRIVDLRSKRRVRQTFFRHEEDAH